MALTKTSKLEAVNIALTSSQLSPVESLNSGDIDAEQAEQILDEVTLEVQTMGWVWNTRIVDLLPDINGNILLEENLLKIDARDPRFKVVQQGNKLYNLEDNTFIFEEKLQVEKVLAFDFEELPQTARRYVSLKTARLLQQRLLGDQGINSDIATEERLAYSQLKRDEVQVQDYNHILNGPTSRYIVSRVGNVPRGARFGNIRR